MGPPPRAGRRFRDRADAGRALSVALRDAGIEAVVALARGGVPVGAEVARALGVPLGVVCPRKVTLASEPEVALGAVCGDGPVVRTAPDGVVGETAWTRAVQVARAASTARAERYGTRSLGGLVEGRTVAVVDDGIATGATMLAAVAAVRSAGARRVVVASPVAPQGAVARFRSLADEVVVVQPPASFAGAVSLAYDDFVQVEDDEVVALVRALSGPRVPPRGGRRAPPG